METGVGLLPCAEQTSTPMVLLISTNFLSLDKTFLPLLNHPLRYKELHVKYV